MDISDFSNWARDIAPFLQFASSGFNLLSVYRKNRKDAEEAEENPETGVKEHVEETAKQDAASSKHGLNWEKVATLFWLGSDLMWIKDMMYRGALPGRVLEGVNNVIAYAGELGFELNSFPLQELGVAKTILQTLAAGPAPSTPEAWQNLAGNYNTVQHHVQSVIWYITALAADRQPGGFVKRRAFPLS